MSLLKDKIEIGIEEAELEVEKTLDQFPPVLKWLIIITVIGLIPGYFIAKNISHKIWTKKLSGSLVTATPSFTDPKNPTLIGIDVTSVGDSNYSAVATLENENLELSLENVPYEFKFFNEKGEQVYVSAGKFFLLPGQTLSSGKRKYIVVPRFTTNEIVHSAKLELPEKLPWQKRLNIDQVKLVTPKPKSYYQTDPAAFVVEGTVHNDSPYSLGQIRLIFLVYNYSGQIIAISARTENSVRDDERRSYKQLWPNVVSEEIADIVVVAETDTLNKENLNLTADEDGPAGDLDRPGAGKN
jgi:hypothetical protein